MEPQQPNNKGTRYDCRHTPISGNRSCEPTAAEAFTIITTNNCPNRDKAHISATTRAVCLQFAVIINKDLFAASKKPGSYFV